MSDSFQCPECDKEYAHEKRLAGKAVACECGHRFLAPPRTPPAAPLKGVPINAGAPPAQQPSATPASSGSGPVRAALPARAVAPAQGGMPKTARWSDPLPANEPTPLTEADLIDDAPAAVQRPPHAPPPSHGIPPAAPVLPPVRHAAPLARSAVRAKTPAGPKSAAAPGQWMAGLMLALLLPIGIIGITAMFYNARRGASGASSNAAPSSSSLPSSSPAPASATPNGEPSPAGQLVTIWDGKKTMSGGQAEFALEYRLDGLQTAEQTKYFWIITDNSQAKLEFPIPWDVLKPRDRLSGRPNLGNAAQFAGPYETYLEKQSPGMTQRERVSNAIRISDR